MGNLRSALFIGLLVLAGAVQAKEAFPSNPDPGLTPGSLCDHPNYYRYPEKIAYCERDVDTQLKHRIIEQYNRQLGYNIERSKRSQFKIDHFIPLCMGGSNNPSNLWPQHQSVYNITDPLEGPLCEKMRDGKLLQKKAIEYITTAKRDLSKAREILREINSL